MQWLVGIIVDKLLSRLISFFSDMFKWYAEKKERDKRLEENQKQLQDALKSKDDNAIKNASEHSLNGD